MVWAWVMATQCTMALEVTATLTLELLDHQEITSLDREDAKLRP